MLRCFAADEDQISRVMEVLFMPFLRLPYFLLSMGALTDLYLPSRPLCDLVQLGGCSQHMHPILSDSPSVEHHGTRTRASSQLGIFLALYGFSLSHNASKKNIALALSKSAYTRISTILLKKRTARHTYTEVRYVAKKYVC